MQKIHSLLTKSEIASIENHIDDLMYKDVEKIPSLIYDKVSKKEINKKQFKLLLTYFYED